MSSNALHSESATFPRKIILSEDRSILTLDWSDGVSHHLRAAWLRACSRSSSALRARVEGLTAERDDDLRIAGVDLVGSYAVNISFSDGHDRGIYPWSYLRELGEGKD